MAKKTVRTADVDGVRSAVDKYGQLDCDIKNAKVKMEALKKPLVSAAQEAIQEGETSVRLKGAKHFTLLVTISNNFVLDTDCEAFAAVKEAVDDGKLAGVIERVETVTVKSGALDTLRSLLGSRFDDLFETETQYTLDDGKLDKLDDGVRATVDACLSESQSTRLKPEVAKTSSVSVETTHYE